MGKLKYEAIQGSDVKRRRISRHDAIEWECRMEYVGNVIFLVIIF